MSQPYIGEIRMFGGNFAPNGWAFCDGSLLDISTNDTLFNLIGTTYGGDGQSTFALPDLRGRIPLHQGQGTGQAYQMGEQGGVETVTLSTNQIPAHTHVPVADRALGTATSPQNAQWASSSLMLYQQSPAGVVPMKPGAIAQSGGSQPHDNMPPFLGVSFIISLYGVYPSPN